MDNFPIGVVYALVGNILNSFGIQLQRLTHIRNKDNVPYLKIPMWWAGLLCMALGELGIMMAYGEAPAAIVAVMGSVSVILNAFMSWYLLGEKSSYSTIIGVLYAACGTTMVIFTAPSSQFHNDQIYENIVSWKGFGVLVAIVTASAYIANPLGLSIAISSEYARKYVVFYCLICSLIEGVSVVSSKAISIAVTQTSSGNAFMFTDHATCWLTYVLILAEIVSNILQVKYLNTALMHFHATMVVPVYYILFTFTSIIIGMIMFDETTFDPFAIKLVIFIAGVILAFMGVVLINKRQIETDNTEEESATSSERGLTDVRVSLVFTNEPTNNAYMGDLLNTETMQ